MGWNLIEQAIDTARRRGRLTPGQAEELRTMRRNVPETAA